MTVSYVVRAREYARRVIEGVENAGELERLACKRFVRDLARQDEADWPFIFDEDAATRPCQFIESLRHIHGKWAGTTIELEDWQLFIVINLFGWLHRDSGLRRFTTGYLEVARKNTKSTLGAAIGLYMFCADGEPGAEVYSAATTGKQAAIVFGIAATMVRRDSDFAAAGIIARERGIYMPSDARKFEPLNAEGSTLDGLNIHCAIVDELHAHVRRGVYDVIATARGAREQAMLLGITTAGFNRSGICYEQRTYVVNVLKQIYVDESYFGIVFTLDDGDDWTDPKVWRKANPNYGVSVIPATFREELNAAKNNVFAQHNFKTKRLNMWVSSEAAWLDMDKWKRCEQLGIKPDDFLHLPCYVGLDLAAKIDMTAKALLFVDRENKKYYLFVTYYLNEVAASESTNSQINGWIEQGLLKITPGNVTDHDVIEVDLLADAEKYDIQGGGIDPAMATQFTAHMLDAGIPLVQVTQAPKYLSDPLKELQGMVYNRELVHDGNPITTWMASNVVAKPIGNSAIFPKKTRAENKIDGIIATILAISQIHAPHQVGIGEFLAQPISG